MKHKSYLIFLIGLIFGGAVIYLTSSPSKTNDIETPKKATPQVATAQTPKKGTDFDFWRLECDEKKTNCNIFQRLTFQQRTPDNKTQNILALNLIIYLAQDENKNKTPRIRFITPLGLNLTAGLAMRVDEGEEFKMPLQVCDTSGCMADYNLGEDVLDKMKNGANIFVGYQLPTTNKPIILKASLKGITAAYKELQKN